MVVVVVVVVGVVRTLLMFSLLFVSIWHRRNIQHDQGIVKVITKSKFILKYLFFFFASH